MEYTNEQLEQAIAGLPEEFQEAIASSHVSNKVQEIGKRYRLSVVQAGKLTDSAMLAALGLIDSANFSEILSKDLVIELPQAQKIVEDINREVFDEIRKSIREKTVETEEEEEVEYQQSTTDNLQPTTNDKTKNGLLEEETLRREDVLHGIENPEPVIGKGTGVSFLGNSLEEKKEEKDVWEITKPVGNKGTGTSLLGNSLGEKKKETPPVQKMASPTPARQNFVEQNLGGQAPTAPMGNIAEQKLAQPFKIESKET
ncbi:MAG: hypothetical protein AAB507_02250, partial [Patescibacteria group bacterium]